MTYRIITKKIQRISAELVNLLNKYSQIRNSMLNLEGYLQMLGKSLKLIIVILAILLAYLLLWPVVVDPQAWNAPDDKGYTGDFAPNTKLAKLKFHDIGDEHGPEDVAVDSAGMVYAAVTAGKVIKIDPKTGEVSDHARTNGRPLGIELDNAGNLLVADSINGLLRIAPDGKQETLIATDPKGAPLVYANDVDSDADGTIYFSESSSKFGAKASGGTLEGSLLEIMEHGGHGRVFRFDPQTKIIETIIKGLTFANGVAVDKEGRFLLVVETGSYRVHKHWLTGEKAGKTEVLIDNLPGFPDNLNHGANGTFWLGIVSKRSALLDKILDKPWLRKVVQRLPAAIRPKAQSYQLVVRFDANGKIIETLQDPAGKYQLTTGAAEGKDGILYITSLTENKLAYLEREE